MHTAVGSSYGCSMALKWVHKSHNNYECLWFLNWALYSCHTSVLRYCISVVGLLSECLRVTIEVSKGCHTGV